MDKRIITPFVENFFETEILPNLINYTKIKNCSPAYDKNWEKEPYALMAAQYIVGWIEGLQLKNATVQLLQDKVEGEDKNYTPFIFVDVPSTKSGVSDDNPILLYGHYDKQPPFDGWSEGLGPYTPVIKGNLLYGRGVADDAYAVFAAITTIKAAQDNNWPLPRIVILIEGAEESYLTDLQHYAGVLKDVIKSPALTICLDSGCLDFERLWATSSLRGTFNIDLKVSVLKSEIHSGLGGGLVPDSFMIARQLIDRIADPDTSEMLSDTLHGDLPKDKEEHIDAMVELLGENYLKLFPFYDKTTPILPKDKIKELMINNTWKPFLTVTGGSGLPDSNSSSSVIRNYTELRLNVRVPPNVKTSACLEETVGILTKDPPYNAKIECNNTSFGYGYSAKPVSNRLTNILKIASQRFYGNDLAYIMEGGTVPFVEMFENLFPTAEICVLGLTGPGSNAHGPNENLNLDFCKKLIMSLTYLISEY